MNTVCYDFIEYLFSYSLYLDFLDGPFVHPKKESSIENENEESTEDQRTWYFYEKDYSKYYQWKDSIKYVLEYCKKEGPFDGILAFSQGNLLLHFLLFFTHPQISSLSIEDEANPLYFMQQIYKELVAEPIPLFKFCILISNFVPSDETLNAHFNKCIQHSIKLQHIPCIAVIGSKDQIIPNENSLEYLQLIQNPLVVIHEGGHFAPRAKELAAPIQKWLQPILQ